jgi:cofilin
MSLTAIKLRDDCLPAWDEIKIGHKNRYIIFNFSDDLKYVVVEKAARKDATYENFLDDLPTRDVRYAVYDYEWKADDETIRNKLVFVVWAPDVAPVKRKMLIASTKVSVKNALTGVSVELQATDDSEIEEKMMLQKCKDTSH